MRRIGGVGGLAALVAAVGAAGAPAAVAPLPTTAPQVLTHGDALPVGGRFVRTGGGGDLLVTWSSGRRVLAASRPDGGRFSTPRTVPGLQQGFADLRGAQPLIAPGGRALFGWPTLDDSRLMLSSSPPN